MRPALFLSLTLFVSSVSAQVRPLNLVPAGEARALPERILGASADPFWEHLLDDPAKLPALKSLHLAYTRFPGGSQSNFYAWKTGKFVVPPKPGMSRYYQMFVRLSQMAGRAFPNGITLEQYKAFSDRIGAEVILVPNLETASVEDQQEWFKHLASKNLVPNHIELGNEFWIAMGMDPSSLRRWPDEQTSVRTMRQYLDAIRPYLPKGAKVAVQAAAAGSFGQVYRRAGVAQRLERWDAALKSEPWFDAVTIHLYPRLNEVLGQPGASQDQLTPQIAERNLRAMMARADDGTANIVRDIGRRVPGKELWITEWNPSGAQSQAQGEAGYPSTPAMMMQFVTRTTLTFLRNPQVTISLYFQLYFNPDNPRCMFVRGQGGYQPLPAAVALSWLDEAANGGATYQRWQESGNPRIPGGGARGDTFAAVEAALFRNQGRTTLIVQNASPESRIWNATALKLGTPSRMERMAMPELSDPSIRPARIESVPPSTDIQLPPYSLMRLVWNNQ